MFIYNFQINIFIGILQGSSIKFGIESKNILPLDGRPEHSQRIIKIKIQLQLPDRLLQCLW